MFAEGRRGRGKVEQNKRFLFFVSLSALASLTGRVGVFVILVLNYTTHGKQRKGPLFLRRCAIHIVMTNSCAFLPPLLVMMLISVLVDKPEPGDILA